MRSLTYGVCLALILMLSGCDKESAERVSPSELTKWIGKGITVHLRRDALGAATNVPIGPTVDSHNGSRMSMRGELQSVDAAGITLQVSKNAGGLCWVPTEVILCICR
jgi:hypothetical protein